MASKMGNPAGEEHESLEESFRLWAKRAGAHFLRKLLIEYPGLEARRADGNIEIGDERFLVELEPCLSLDTSHTRGQWATLWAFASHQPGYKFMIVLPESCAAATGERLTRKEVQAWASGVLDEVEAELAVKRIPVDRKRIIYLFL